MLICLSVSQTVLRLISLAFSLPDSLPVWLAVCLSVCCSVCMSVGRSVCLVSLLISLSVCLFFNTSVCNSVSFCWLICLSFSLYFCQLVYVSVVQSVRWSACESVSDRQSDGVSVSKLTHLPVCLSVRWLVGFVCSLLFCLSFG